MPHVIQPAPTARAKCRGCGERIAAGELRFGETVPNPFAEGETTHWFHPACAALKRPEPFLETLEGQGEALEDAERLAAEARLGVELPRLPRIDGAERASSGRAQCRSCREVIAKGAWRIKLVYYENARFEPSGFVHLPCAADYFGTADVIARIRRFAPALTDAETKEIEAELRSAPA